jgi:hypothetical protein
VLKITQSYVEGVQSWELEAVDVEAEIPCGSLIFARIDFNQIQRMNLSWTCCKVYLSGMEIGVNTEPPATPTRKMDFIRRDLCSRRILIKDLMVRVILFV